MSSIAKQLRDKIENERAYGRKNQDGSYNITISDGMAMDIVRMLEASK